MRIALVLEHYNARGGGLEQWACQLAGCLQQRGHELTVVAFQISGQVESPAFKVHLLPWQECRLARASAVEAALKKLDVDVTHDLGVGWSADVLHPQTGCRWANYRRELRSLSRGQRILRALRPRQRRWLQQVRGLERLQYERTSSLVVAVSRMVARDLREAYSVAPERVRQIPNGVDLRRFSPALPAARAQARHRMGLSDRTVFLFAAHNPRLKGLRPLLKAFGECVRKRPQMCLVAIGKEPSAEFVRMVRAERLERSVIFAGLVDDTGPYFAAADTFVLPSYYDACSLSVLEACACGLPVITTRQNGASELLTDGREGRILEDAGDIGALAGGLLELADGEVRTAMGARALELAAGCSFERNVDALEKVYLESLETHSG